MFSSKETKNSSDKGLEYRRLPSPHQLFVGHNDYCFVIINTTIQVAKIMILRLIVNSAFQHILCGQRLPRPILALKEDTGCREGAQAPAGRSARHSPSLHRSFHTHPAAAGRAACPGSGPGSRTLAYPILMILVF